MFHKTHLIRWSYVLALTLVSIFLSGKASAQWAGATRDTLTRDSFRDESVAQSLVCEPDNSLHVIWQRAVPTGGWRILYVKRPAGQGWSLPRTASDTSIAAFQSALAYSFRTGTPFIAYRATHATSDEIVVVKDSAGIWVTTRLTTDSSPDLAPTIAVDRNSTVHLAWIGRDASNNWKILYANNITGSWRTQLLAASELGDFGSGAAPSVAVTSAGIAHIFYRGGNYPDYHIHHASNSQAGDTLWTYEIVTTPNGSDYTSSAVVDTSGTLHLLASGNDGFGFPPHAYYLKKPSGGPWSGAELANPGGTGLGGSLIVDRFGKAHISWDEVSGNIITGNLYYATNKTGSWTITPVQTDAATFNGVLAVDGTGHGHIVAYNGATFQTQEIIVIHSNGLVTGIREGSQGIPNALMLFQNYPNPFNPTTTIQFQIPVGTYGHTSLRVYDLLGRDVAILVNEEMKPGSYESIFDASNIASGVFLYQLHTNGQSITRKLLIIK